MNKKKFTLVFFCVMVIITHRLVYLMGMEHQKVIDTPKTLTHVDVIYLPETFYDGEGNIIPNEAVHSLVKTQFVCGDSLDSVLLHENFPM